MNLKRQGQLQKQYLRNLVIESLTWPVKQSELFHHNARNYLHQTFKFGLNQSQPQPINVYQHRAGDDPENLIKVCKNIDVYSFMSIGADFQYELISTCIVRVSKNNRVYLDFAERIPWQTEIKEILGRLTDRQDCQAIQNDQDDTYVVVSSHWKRGEIYKGQNFFIGDEIKLGTLQYKVVQVCIDKQIFRLPGARIMPEDLLSSAEKTEAPIPCRICYQNEQEGNDYLVQPCACTGSCQNVHILCLEQWLSVQRNNNKIDATCEICQKELKFNKRGKVRQRLINLREPIGNYIRLQGVGPRNDDIVLIDNVTENYTQIGRSNQCEVIIPDEQISKQHARVACINRQFYLLDCDSAYGTLIRKKQLTLELHWVPKKIQIGRTVLSFRISN